MTSFPLREATPPPVLDHSRPVSRQDYGGKRHSTGRERPGKREGFLSRHCRFVNVVATDHERERLADAPRVTKLSGIREPPSSEVEVLTLCGHGDATTTSHTTTYPQAFWRTIERVSTATSLFRQPSRPTGLALQACGVARGAQSNRRQWMILVDGCRVLGQHPIGDHAVAEHGQISHRLERQVGLAGRDRPGQGGPKVVQLRLDALTPFGLVCTA